ncbi:MAG: hypothetical protein BGO21_26180 [Dyadobacter sp. 50-39]|uniref:aldo/keto reductase n=1 Tax=Dyadobacter sp. 50-39 TaxID=1895756 RepID=UPI0009605EB7|nr:aldo/keto reductase [Dyadobacter sp. 50-39]OJV16389.1 MAG: hypothetical protein BGO21_26180 [Dyadobacter sp. 50-39]
MEYRKLGRTGLDCSVLGFGTWQIGGGRWKGMHLDESISLLTSAFASGVNIFDVAVVYGLYHGKINERRSHSLELLGKAFKGYDRSKIIINLKIGQIDEYSHRAAYDPRNLISQVKAALSQLETDYIDICLIHAPSIAEIKDRIGLTVLETLRELGIVRFIGYSFEAQPRHAEMALTQNVDVVMLQYNLLENDCESIFKMAEEHGTGILVGGPFKRGYLTGKYDTIHDLPAEDDYWAWNLRYCTQKVNETLKKVALLKEKVGGASELRYNAIAHILQHPAASSIIVGHRSLDEVIENQTAASKILTEKTNSLINDE